MEKDIKEIKEDVKAIRQWMEITNVGKTQYIQQWSNRHTENPDILSDTTSVTSTGSEDDFGFRRKCLSEAVQRHFLTILRNVPYDAIADLVVQEQVVAVTENQRIRGLALDDDRMRSLLRNVMDKDYKTMIKFLNIVGKCDAPLKESILGTYNDRYGTTPTGFIIRCTVCPIKQRVNQKDFCDHLFTRELISRELHKEATELQATQGNGIVWQRLLEELSKERSEYILNVVKEILTDGEGEEVSHHDDIIKRIERDIRKQRSFKCRCITNRKRKVVHLSPSTSSSGVKSKQEAVADQTSLITKKPKAGSREISKSSIKK